MFVQCCVLDGLSDALLVATGKEDEIVVEEGEIWSCPGEGVLVVAV